MGYTDKVKLVPHNAAGVYDIPLFINLGLKSKVDEYLLNQYNELHKPEYNGGGTF